MALHRQLPRLRLRQRHRTQLPRLLLHKRCHHRLRSPRIAPDRYITRILVDAFQYSGFWIVPGVQKDTETYVVELARAADSGAGARRCWRTDVRGRMGLGCRLGPRRARRYGRLWVVDDRSAEVQEVGFCPCNSGMRMY
jgi:hypothetical protein